MLRGTYSFAELEVSAEAFDEIAGLLQAAGYDVMVNGAIDMHGIGLTRGAPRSARSDTPESASIRVPAPAESVTPADDRERTAGDWGDCTLYG